MANNNKKKQVVDFSKRIKERKSTILRRFDGVEIPEVFEGKRVIGWKFWYGKKYIEVVNE